MCAVCGIVHDGRAKACITKLMDDRDALQRVVDLCVSLYGQGILEPYPDYHEQEDEALRFRCEMRRRLGAENSVLNKPQER